VAYCESESEFLVGALQRVEQQIPHLCCLALELQEAILAVVILNIRIHSLCWSQGV